MTFRSVNGGFHTKASVKWQEIFITFLIPKLIMARNLRKSAFIKRKGSPQMDNPFLTNHLQWLIPNLFLIIYRTNKV